MKIRLLHVITNLSVGGAETALLNLVREIDGEKFENVVVSLMSDKEVGETLKSLGVKVYALGMRRGIPDPVSALKLFFILKKEKPDIIQTWLYHADLFGTIVNMLSFSKKPIVWNIRCSDMLGDDGKASLKLVMKTLSFLSGTVQAVIVNSVVGKKFHEQFGYRVKRWEVIPNGFDLSKFSPSKNAKVKMRESLKVSANAKIVGLVGRYDPVKDHETFLKSASVVLSKFPYTKFVLVGEGMTQDNAELVHIAQRENIKDSLLLLGRRDDIADVTASFDVAVSSSLSEGFSNTIGEAMACSVPCVVTDVGDSADIVGDCGSVIKPRDFESLGNEIVKILSMDDTAREAFGERARDRVSQKYELSVMVKRYEQVYESLAFEGKK